MNTRTRISLACPQLQRRLLTSWLWLASTLLICSLPAHATIFEFPGTGGITINSSGDATPYPSTISVSGITGSVISVKVKINGFSHTFPSDVDVYLLSPSGQVSVVFSDAGSSTDAVNANLVFDDAAASPIAGSGSITSGTYRPANYSSIETLPPGGSGTAGSILTALGVDGVNGDWKLFVRDDTGGDAGSIASWALVIETGTPVPEITFEQPAGSPLSAASTVTYSNQMVGTLSAVKTFVIKNVGTAALAVNSVSVTGGASGDFVVDTTGMASSVPAFGQTTFAVAFNPAAAGARTTTLRIVSDDSDEATTDFTLSGTGFVPAPEIELRSPSSVTLANGGSFSFGGQFVGVTGNVWTFTIGNTGTGPLNVSSVGVTGGNAGDFIINTAGMTASVPVGGQTTFTVTFTAGALGARSTTLRVLNDDADESTTDITLNGTGTNSNPTLSGLTIGGASLAPAFAPATTSYTAIVPNATTSVTVTPTAAVAAGTTIKVKGSVVSSGAASSPISLFVGVNTITTVVTAADGITTMTYTIALTRAGSNPGSVDPGLSLNLGGAAPSVYATASQMDGRIIIGGLFNSVGGTARNHVARLNADGSPDPGFNPDANGVVRCVAVQADGQVLLGGDFTTISGSTRSGLARVLADGSLDTAFTPNPDAAVTGMTVQPDGKILVVGSFTHIAGNARQYIARLLANGALDTSFNAGASADAPIVHLFQQTDGRVLIGGAFSTVAGSAHTGVARLNTDGTLDTTFANPALGGPGAAVHCTVVQTDGQVVIGGSFATVGGVSHPGLARLNANGTLDTTFPSSLGTTAPGITPTAESLALQSDGGLIVAGIFDSVNGTPRNGLARVYSYSGVDGAFVLSGVTADGGSVGWQGVTLLADGKVLIAGPHMIGNASAYLSLLINNTATQTLSRVTSTSLRWTRSGSAPETQQVSFDLSTDGGSSWSFLGEATRFSYIPYGYGSGLSDWGLDGLSLPANARVRARARITGGTHGGSLGEVQFASVPSAPTVTYGPVRETTSTGARLECFVNPNGSATSVLFEYGTSSAPYSQSQTLTLSPNDGFLGQVLPVMVTGLQPNTLYFYRISATNASGTTTGPSAYLYTDDPAPTVVTGGASDLTINSAKVAGTVNPNGATTNVTFQYGTTLAYGSTAPMNYSPNWLGSGSTTQSVTADLTGLLPNTTYHYRVIAANEGGFSAGVDMTFTTPATGTPAIIVEHDDVTDVQLVSGGTAIDLGSVYSGGREYLYLNVRNQGVGLLNLGAITLTGANPADFALVTSPATSVPPGGETWFSVRFTPMATGVRNATLSLPSNDPAQSPFLINLTGQGAGAGGSLKVTLTPAAAITAGARWLVDNDSTWSSGSTMSGLAPGTHTVRFKAIPGFTTPARQTVTITAGQTATVSFAYTPPTTQYQWTNMAGQPGGQGNVNGPASTARFYRPQGVVVDGGGNLFVADEWNGRIRKITPAGVVTTFVDGDDYGYFNPEALAIDGAGNLYVGTSEQEVLKITPAGSITTLAGVSSYDSVTVDGAGSAARFSNIVCLSADGSGNVFVIDQNAIRKITPAGNVTTIAGFARLEGYADSTSPLNLSGVPLFDSPQGLAVDAGGTIYVADYGNNVIRKITPDGTVSTLAGVAGLPTTEWANGPGDQARFAGPTAITLASDGSLLVADFYGLRRVTTSGYVTALAGGYGTIIPFHSVQGLAADGAGNAYLTEAYRDVIYKVTPAGAISILAGLLSTADVINGPGSTARFDGPSGLAFDAAGTLFVTDQFSCDIRTISPAALVGTFAGSTYGSVDGPAHSAQFATPSGLCFDPAGNLWVAANSTVRKISPAGDVTTPVGSMNQTGSVDGNGNAARFNYPKAVAADSSGNLYVADHSNHTIRKVTPSGQVTTLAGTPQIRGFRDGPGNVALFSYPNAIAIDGNGILYVTDGYGVRQITPDGTVTTVVADSQIDWSLSGITIDTNGTLFVTNSSLHTIYRITAQGRITLIGGTPGVQGGADGTGTAALFSGPEGIAVSSTGVLYVADRANNRISQGAEVAVQQKIDVQLPPGDSLASGTDPVDMGTQVINTTSAVKTFTIVNLGGASLTLGAITKTGASAADFIVSTTGMTTTLAPGASTTFSLTFKPAALGSRSATLQIASNDASLNPFEIPLTGTSVTSIAIANVQQTAGVNLTSGLSAVDFGAMSVGGSVKRTFTIKNTGKAALTNFVLTINGAHGADFTVTTSPAASVAANGSTTFTVTFVPGAAGGRTAALHLASNDPVHSPFDINLTGVGAVTPTITSDPPSMIAGLGLPASMSVTADGGGLAYQWLKGTATISGAKSSIYAINAAALTHAGTYSVKVSNAASSVSSKTANLGIVSVAPTTVTTVEGNTITLTVAAAAPGIGYEWRKHGSKLTNGVNPLNSASTIAGATTSKLTISKATAADADTYTCNITMPDAQNAAVKVQRESGVFTAKVTVLPLIDVVSIGPWIVGGTITDVISSTNAPTSFKLSGQPAGVGIDSSGHFTGRPAVTITVPTTYHLTITASNARGTSAPLLRDVVVHPLQNNVIGTFNGLVDRDTTLTSGHGGSIKVTSSNLGVITGTLTLGSFSKSLSGQLNALVNASPSATIQIARPLPFHNVTLTFQLNKDTGELTGSVTDGIIAPPVTAQGWRNPWSTQRKTALAATYTAALDLDPALKGTQATPANVAFPQGTGFGTLTIGATGTASWSGKTGDNQTTTASVTLSEAGDVPIHVMLYNGNGSLHGWVRLSADSVATPTNGGLRLLDGQLDWEKSAPASTTDHTYKAGFARHSLTVLGGEYVKPVGKAVLGLIDGGTGTTNAKVTFTEGGLSGPSPIVPAVMATAPNKPFRITSTNTLVLPAGTTDNPAALTLKLDAATGAFSGQFVLKNDPDPTDTTAPIATLSRTASYYGLLIPRLGVNQGRGCFLLSELPALLPVKTTLSTSPVLSGNVVIDAK